MSTVVWSGGANDGNFGTAGNWVGGVAPIGNDDVIIGIGAQNITAGLATGIALTTFTVNPGYSGSIGDSSGNALTFGAVTTIRYAGTGAFARLSSSGTVTSGKLEHSGSSKVYIAGGTWTTLTNSSGDVDIAAGAVVTTCNNVAGNIDAAYNATAFSTLTNGGVVGFKRNATILNAIRGTAIQQNNGTTTYTACATANIYPGALYNKQSGGDETTMNLYPGGVFTAAQNAGNGTTGSITLATVNQWAGSTLNRFGVPGVTLAVTTYNAIGAAYGSSSSGDLP